MSLRRACLGCGRLTRDGSRCQDCQGERDRRRGTTAQRGYGSAHQRMRQRLLDRYYPGDPCPRCHQPLGSDPAALDLDHAPDRFGYLGLSHRRCNRGADQRVSPKGTAALTPRPPKFPTHTGDDGPAVA